MLGSAGDWATYDTFFGGGMFTDTVKYDRMDRRSGCCTRPTRPCATSRSSWGTSVRAPW